MTDEQLHIEQLMIEKAAGIIGDDENRYLEELLEKSDAARELWQRISSHAKSLMTEPEQDEVEAWEHVREEISRGSGAGVRKLKRWLAAAAAAVLVFFAGRYLIHTFHPAPAPSFAAKKSVQLILNGSQTIDLSDPSTRNLPVPGNVQLVAAAGSLRFNALNHEVSHALNTLVVPATLSYRVTLADGTQVSLNSLSELRFGFAFSGDKREVWLKGEAYFRVAKDPAHPFIVHTPLTDIRVLGTEFNVNTYDSTEVRTALVSGAVSTRQHAGEDSVLLQPGDEADFSDDRGFRVHQFDQADILSWMQGVYYFKNVPLASIAQAVNRWYDATMVFDDHDAASMRFTGALLKNRPLDEFLSNLAITSNIRVDFDRATGMIRLSAR